MVGVSFSMLEWIADSIMLRAKAMITVMTRADYSDDEGKGNDYSDDDG